MADSPQHVAIIMDGNGRWARSRGMPRPAGHRASVKVVRRVVEECAKRKVRYLTLFAFSSENWRRPADEVGMLMNLFLDALEREVADLHRNQVRLTFIGDRGCG
jgi:undecaprenyl diphosphate synthase